MNFKSLVLLMCVCEIIPFSWSSCPSDEYVDCADEGDECDVPSSIKRGYISYGTEGRFTLIPFSNHKGETFSIDCDNDFGDVYPGETKYCCYIEVEHTGFDEEDLSDAYVSEDDADWVFGGGIWTMSYGYDDQLVYRVISDAKGYCDNDFMNDPVSGEDKECRWSSTTPDVLWSTSWDICANEDDDCDGLDSSAHWIRYGEGSSLYYRLVVTSDGKIPCDNDFFNDPVSGTGKFCWKSEPQYTFSGGVGEWKRVPSCGGCSSNQYTQTIGIKELTASEISNSWSLSLTTTLSNDYAFGSTTLSATVSTSVTNTLTNSLTTEKTLTTKYTCDKNAVYQWVTGVTQNNGIFSTDFTISSEDFWCIDSGLTPQCAPGFCLDDNCQQCNY